MTATALQNHGSSISFIPRMNAAGKEMGKRMTFSGNETAGDLRKRLKAAGQKGKELTANVNAVIAGDADAKRILGQAVMTHLGQQGFVPDVVDINKKGGVAKITLIKVEAPKLTTAEVVAMSDEDRSALLKMLQDADTAAKAKKDVIPV